MEVLLPSPQPPFPYSQGPQLHQYFRPTYFSLALYRSIISETCLHCSKSSLPSSSFYFNSLLFISYPLPHIHMGIFVCLFIKRICLTELYGLSTHFQQAPFVCCVSVPGDGHNTFLVCYCTKRGSSQKLKSLMRRKNMCKCNDEMKVF